MRRCERFCWILLIQSFPFWTNYRTPLPDGMFIWACFTLINIVTLCIKRFSFICASALHYFPWICIHNFDTLFMHGTPVTVACYLHNSWDCWCVSASRDAENFYYTTLHTSRPTDLCDNTTMCDLAVISRTCVGRVFTTVNACTPTNVYCYITYLFRLLEILSF